MAINNYEKLKKAMLTELIESQYEAEVARLLELRPIEDMQAQPDLVELITQRALSDEPISYTEYPNARMDLASRALHLSGFNPQGEGFGSNISKEDFDKLLDITLGEGQGFVDDDVVKLLIKYQNDKESYQIDDQIKGYLDSYLESNLERIVDIADKKEIPHEPVDVPATPENTTPAVREDVPADELVADSNLDQNVATVERSDLDFEPDYVRNVDTENEARKAISKIIASARQGDPANNVESVNFVERKVVDKLKSFIQNKAADTLDRYPLDYPSESLFSSSLSEMDDNGRVTKVHLHYKRNKVVMPAANSPKEVYDIMAAKVMEKGIKNPYIKANFRNPADAEKFIRNTISSLTALGYDIEDMSCHPRNEVLFESIKAEYLDMINTIEEAPPVPDAPELSNENAIPTLEQANVAVTSITLARTAAENPMPVEQFTAEQLSTILEHTPYLQSAGEDVNGDDVQLTARNIDTVNLGVEYVEKLINKIGSERGLGAREAEKLGAISPEMVKLAFQGKADVYAKYESFEPPEQQNRQQNDVGNDQGQQNYNGEQASQGYDDPSGGYQSPQNGDFPPDNSEPATEAQPSDPNWHLQQDDGYADMGGGNNEPPPMYEEEMQGGAPPHSESSPSEQPPSNQATDQVAPEKQKPDMSKGDKFMMSIAQTAKNKDGSLDFMSSKQIKTVAVISAMSSLPDGDENKVAINDVSKAMIEKVKKSVADDITGMTNGERVTKDRYKALVSQSDRVLTVLAGESAVKDVAAIKERASLQKDTSQKAPQTPPPEEAPIAEQSNDASVPETPPEQVSESGLKVEGEKGKAEDLFALPTAAYEEKADLDIPREPEKTNIDLAKMEGAEIEKLQEAFPEVVAQALKEMLELPQIPGEQSNVDKLPESVKQANSELLGLDLPKESVNQEEVSNKPENKDDEPKNAPASPTRKR